jgi:hypothetical protein
MTDPTPEHPDGPVPEVDGDVDLASALVDGEATPDEEGRADDRAVQAHRAAFASVAARVGDVPAPPAGLVDDQVGAALAAFDGDAAGAGDDVAPAVSLADRRPWWQRAPLGAVAAAVAVVALVGAIGFAAVTDDGEDHDTATAMLDGDDEGAVDDAVGSEAFRAEGDVGAGTAAATYADLDELAEDLARQVSEPAVADAEQATTTALAPAADATTEAADGVEAAEACDAIGATGLDPASVRLVATAVVGDQPVTAVVHGAEGDLLLTVVDAGTCEVVDERRL